MENQIGGETLRAAMLPYGQQWIEEDDIRAVVEVLKSSFLTTGPKIKEFEEKLAEYVNAKYAVAVANGTAALHAAYFAAGLRGGDEVITTPMTFAATANAVLYCGGKPIFADIDPRTYNIDPQAIKSKITSRTKAIVPVHFTGQPCDMADILRIAEEHNLIVIEDGAHALGAEYQGEKIGNIGAMTTFSFHPVKHITTGEGGAITTNDERLYKQLLNFRTHGITRDSEVLINNEGPWYYEQIFLGYNYRMTDIQAALGVSQIAKLERFLAKRREYAEIYSQAFNDSDIISIPYQADGVNSAWHLYIIKLNLDKVKAGRLEIFNDLMSRNIGVNVHYIPVYYHPYYRSIGYDKGTCPNAEKLYESMISLPLFPKMDINDVEYVIRHVRQVLNKYRAE